MMNDFVSETDLWKHVNGTTVSEIAKKGEVSNTQFYADELVQWSTNNRVQ